MPKLYEFVDGALEVNFHPGQLKAWDSEKRIVAIIAGGRSGKALALDTPIPTPDGFVPMRSLRKGSTVFDRHGQPCRVVDVFPVLLGRKCYRITFDDRTFVIADADHLWITQTHKQRKNQARRRPPSTWSDTRPQSRATPDESVVTTEEICRTLERRRGPAAHRLNESNHSISNCGPVQTPETSLPIPPYTLGVWLGDGHSSSAVITSADEEILANIAADGISVGTAKEGGSGKAKEYRIGAVRTLKPWDDERQSQAIFLWQFGYNLTEIAEKMGSCRHRVQDILEQAGVQIERRPARLSHRKRSSSGVFLPGKLERPEVTDQSRSLQALLRREGLIGNKHVPSAYLFASEKDRLALLQGLMDTDGYCSTGSKKTCEFSNTNKSLARAVLHLLASLGIKARVSTKIPILYGVPQQMCYRVTFTTGFAVFRLSRKLERLGISPKSSNGRRFIVAVEEVPSVPVRCITVDSPDHTYLCTESFIPTHNSSFAPLWLHREMRRKGPGDYLVAAPNYPIIDKAAGPEIQALFERILGLGKMKSSPPKFIVSDKGAMELWGVIPERPSRILFGHADDPESLEAMSAKAAWLDEAGQGKFKLDSWQAVQQRLSLDQGRVLISSKPYNLAWMKQRIYDPWKEAKGNHPEIEVINFDSSANPAFPREELLRAKRELPPWKYAMQYLGLFTRPAGLIYDCFNPAKHKVPRFTLPDHWPRFLGLDFGLVNTAGLFFAAELDHNNKPTRRLFCYREYRGGGFTMAEHIVALMKGEPKIPYCVGGSGSEGIWRAEFAKGGRVRDPAVAGGWRQVHGLPVHPPAVREVDVGIARVYSAFRRDEILIFDDLPGLLDELESYSYEVDEAGEPNPLKISDKEMYHLLDSCRYVISYLKRDASGSPAQRTGASAKGGLNLNAPISR